VRSGRHSRPQTVAEEAGHSSLTYLQHLEAESIQIMREVVAEAERPVMLYSIGKDSSVMLHLAMKAFYPGKPPFPLLHVDTTWKFREMYEFRDATVARLGLELIVHTNKEGLAAGIGPITHGSAVHTDVMKTQALKQAIDAYRFDVAFGGARRDEEASRAKERVVPFDGASLGPEEPAPRALAPLQRAHATGRVDPRFPALELDRARRLAVHLSRGHTDGPPVLRKGEAGCRA
jgi:3'-phosphoadenosine 5'-phosphosulfate sulfotransferase (PAPS reductase)/FAD synthetase